MIHAKDAVKPKKITQRRVVDLGDIDQVLNSKQISNRRRDQSMHNADSEFQPRRLRSRIQSQVDLSDRQHEINLGAKDVITKYEKEDLVREIRRLTDATMTSNGSANWDFLVQVQDRNQRV